MREKTEIFKGYFITKDNEALFFNLDGFEDIDHKDTKENILSNMNMKHLKPLKKLFKSCGLKLLKLEYYSPKAYNFSGDSIDLYISIDNKKLLINYVNKKKDLIQKSLNDNKSYDGYMALTESNIEEIKEKINDKSEVSVIIIKEILKEYPLDLYGDFLELHIDDYKKD